MELLSARSRRDVFGDGGLLCRTLQRGAGSRPASGDVVRLGWRRWRAAEPAAVASRDGVRLALSAAEGPADLLPMDALRTLLPRMRPGQVAEVRAEPPYAWLPSLSERASSEGLPQRTKCGNASGAPVEFE